MVHLGYVENNVLHLNSNLSEEEAEEEDNTNVGEARDKGEVINARTKIRFAQFRCNTLQRLTVLTGVI